MRHWVTLLLAAIVVLAFAAPAFAANAAGYEAPAGNEGEIPDEEPFTPPRPIPPPGRDTTTTRTTPLGQTGGDDLADTGFAVTTGMVAASALVLGGAVLVVSTRRRRDGEVG